MNAPHASWHVGSNFTCKCIVQHLSCTERHFASDVCGIHVPIDGSDSDDMVLTVSGRTNESPRKG
jgi:hypothetical protein